MISTARYQTLGRRSTRRTSKAHGRPPYLVPLCAVGAGAALAVTGARRGTAVRPAGALSTPARPAAPGTSPAPRVPWVVLPTFNEAENIEAIVGTVVCVLQQAAPAGYRVLIVDDNSPDGTGVIADSLAARYACVEVLHRSEREGLGPAYVAGFRRALAQGAGYVLEMDADGSHDPRDLARLLAAVHDGSADLALGSRYVAGGQITNWSLLRRATSRGGCWYARTVLGLGVRDLTGGFKCYASDVLLAIDLANLRSQGYVFQIELTYRALQAGFTVHEVPITFRDRRHGSSKMSWPIALEAAWRVPQLRRGGRPNRRRTVPRPRGSLVAGTHREPGAVAVLGQGKR